MNKMLIALAVAARTLVPAPARATTRLLAVSSVLFGPAVASERWIITVIHRTKGFRC
jgi:hypothetical protein